VSAPLCAKPSLTSATLRPFTPCRIDDIDVTLEYRDAIEAFETRRHAATPCLPTAQRD
jgi:hypothetical protein